MFHRQTDRLAEGFTSPCGVFAAGLVILGRGHQATLAPIQPRRSGTLPAEWRLSFAGDAVISPLARYAKQPLLIRVRRLLGLWCFAWATLHPTSYTLLSWALTIWLCWVRRLSPAPYLDIGHDQLGDCWRWR